MAAEATVEAAVAASTAVAVGAAVFMVAAEAADTTARPAAAGRTRWNIDGALGFGVPGGGRCGLFTTAGAFAVTANLSQQMNALPIQIFSDITSPRNAIVNRAWGAALTLVVLILILNLIARAIARRSRMA